MSFKIADANKSVTSREQVKKTYFKLKDGANVYRILPPMFSCADTGHWTKFYRVEYGYKDSRDRMHPFVDVREVNRKTKMVEVESAAFLKREKLKLQLDEAKKKNLPETVIAKLKDLVERYNQASHHYMNVISLDGQIGLLKIPHRAKMALDEAIKGLEAQGVYPLSFDNGRFFVFNRSGYALDTLHQVSVYKERVQTAEYGIVEKDVVHRLTDDIVARLPRECSDLNNLFLRITPEEVQTVVEGTPDDFDAILERYKQEAKKEELVDVEEPEMDDTPAVTRPSVQAPIKTTYVAPVQTAQPVQPAVAQQAYVAPPVQVAPVQPVAQAVVKPVASPATDVVNMGDEEFMKYLQGELG